MSDPRDVSTQAKYLFQSGPKEEERQDAKRTVYSPELDPEYDNLQIDRKGWESSNPGGHGTRRRLHKISTDELFCRSS
jgi:hypothetical protein